MPISTSSTHSLRAFQQILNPIKKTVVIVIITAVFERLYFGKNRTTKTLRALVF